MDIIESASLYEYELTMTTLWQKAISGQESCLRLFELQEREGFEDHLDSHILSGKIRERYMNVGLYHGKPILCFQAESFRRQYESCAQSMSVVQRDRLLDMMLTWENVAEKRGMAVYSFDHHDLAWLPSPEDVLSLGVIGLYDLYRTEEACYARIPEYIQILNRAIDRYKYLACAEIVKHPENFNARRIYEALGQVKYLAPVTLFQTLQMLLLHCQIFRPDHMERIDCLLYRFFQEQDFRDGGVISSLRGTIREFLSRYMYCVHSIGCKASITFEDQTHQELYSLIREIMNN